MRRLGALALVLLTAAVVQENPWAESASSLVEKGNRLYREKRYDEALEAYGRAMQQAPGSPVLNLNIGNALYGKGEYEKAYERYRQAFTAKEKNLAQGARFNAGNAHFAQEKWQEAIQHYKEALRIDSADRDAKKNLELALRRLEQQKQQQPPPQEQNQQQQDQTSSRSRTRSLPTSPRISNSSNSRGASRRRRISSRRRLPRIATRFRRKRRCGFSTR